MNDLSLLPSLPMHVETILPWWITNTTPIEDAILSMCRAQKVVKVDVGTNVSWAVKLSQILYIVLFRIFEYPYAGNVSAPHAGGNSTQKKGNSIRIERW